MYLPQELKAIQTDSKRIGFLQGCNEQTGSLLRTLAATQPDGHFLELGTGTGISTAWLLDGMNNRAMLVTVDLNEVVQSLAIQYLGEDDRVKFVRSEDGDFIKRQARNQYDFIFADTEPGKFTYLDETLDLLRIGGIYVTSDLLPQPYWQAGQQEQVDELVQNFASRDDFIVTTMDWSTGILVAVKVFRALQTGADW